LRFELDEDLRQAIIDHCLAGLPSEACGMLALDGDRVVSVYPTANLDDSPKSYTIPPKEHYEALIDAESRGWTLSGVFHSHPRGPNGLSDTDIKKLTDPTWLYIVVSLAGPVPLISAWCRGSEVQLAST
jgi:proteasome lid subunit RPN8/RPN11